MGIMGVSHSGHGKSEKGKLRNYPPLEYSIFALHSLGSHKF